MTSSNPRFLLVYGTQTGQSKAIAEEIVQRSDKAGLDADIHCFGRIEKEFVLERECLVVIVVSTTGDGDVPDTVSKFWRRIKRKTMSKDHFINMTYSLLGLGDSNYSNFCKCPHMIDDRLLELGATHFMEPGFADDATGLEVVVEPWIDSLIEKLCDMKGLPPPSEDNKAVNGALNLKLKNSKEDDSTEQISELSLSELITKNLSITSPTVASNGDISNKDASDCGQSETAPKKISECRAEDLPLETSLPPSPMSNSWLSDIPLPNIEEFTLPSAPPSYIQIEYLSDFSLLTGSLPIQNNCKLPFANSPIYSVPIGCIKPLSEGNLVKGTLLVELASSEVTEYKSGDSFSIIAQNDDREVTWLLDRLCVAEPNCPINLSVRADTTKKKAAVPEFINSPSTPYEIFSRSVDIRHSPKKAFLRDLANFCTDSSEKTKLLFLCSRQGSDSYRRFITESKRGLLDILVAFTTCTPKLESLIENLPRLLPRPYSAACASGAPRLKFAFNVIDLPSIGSLTDRKGLVTGCFDDVRKSAPDILPKVSIYLRTQQHFRLPSDPSLPLILIGPGTGIAPFVGFLEDREKLLQSGEQLGDCLLFFGNRLEQGDYLFREELSHHVTVGSLTGLHVCFSRDSEHISKTGAKYVTDLLKQQSSVISRLITKESAYIYVCGDAKNMAKDVNQAITEILKTENGYTGDEVLTVIKGLRDDKRYKEDVWT